MDIELPVRVHMEHGVVFRVRPISLFTILWIAIGLSGCAITSKANLPGSVAVTLTPASSSVQVSQSQQFDAVVQNDAQNKGVTWGLTQSGTSCSPGCGVLIESGSQAAYSAPAAVPQLSMVTLTATSVSDRTKSASALITVVATPSAAISVSITPTSASVALSQNQLFSAVVQNDVQNKGVVWALTQSGAACSPQCGTIPGYTTQTAVYVAPVSAPNATGLVITATSLADSSQSASAVIDIPSSAPTGGAGAGGVDITKFGARSVTTAPTATAACTSGSNVVTLSNGGWPQDFTQFENGDSIRVDNCGPPTAMTPPTGVSVSPGMNAGGTPAVPVASLGTGSYSYEVIACDKLGGCSAASSPASTSSGAPTLGRVTAKVTRMSLSNNVMTVTTSAAHGFVANALVYIQYFSTQTPSFEGSYIISGAPSPTTFTFLTSIDSRIGGTPTLDTSGGVAVAFNCNVASWKPVTNAWKYFIYGRDLVSTKLIGVAEPGTTSWQDYGPTMMGNFSFPSFVSRTPPSQPTNQYLITTISSGAGTPSVVLATGAANTVANVSARMGSDAAILAAFQAGIYGAVSIPQGTYQVAGYLDLHTYGPIYVSQNGVLDVADTIQIPGGMYWNGTGGAYTTAFQPSPTALISGGPGSYPTVYLGTNSGGELQFDHVTLSNNSDNGTLLFYADSGVNFHFDYTTFAAGNGNHLGYMDRHFIIRTGGFDYNFSNCLFAADEVPTGTIADVGYTFLPSALFVPLGPVGSGSGYFQHSWFLGKSAVESNASGAQYGAPYQEFDDTRTQSDSLPVYVVSNYPSQNTQNQIVYFYGFSPADYPSAMTGNWAGLTLTVGLQNLSNVPTGSRPLVVGNPTVFIGQSGGTASSGPSGGGWYATGGSQVGYLIPPPASPPLLTNSSGGAVPIGSHTYQVAWTDAFGNSTTAGPSATISIVSGMQTVLVTPPAAPAGALGWQYYRDGFLGAPTTAGCGPFGLGTSESDVLPFGCGNSAPAQNTAMSSGQGTNGEETTAITLTGGGYETVISGTFTADRKLAVPDVSGTIAVKIANGTVIMPVDAVAADSCGTIVAATATGVLPSDVVKFTENGALQLSPGDLKIRTSAASNVVNFQYCNQTVLSITPIPTTLNWQVIR